jgi:CBS domain-containing protein
MPGAMTFIAHDIDAAGSAAALQPAASRIDALVLERHAAGVPAHAIAAEVSALNQRLFSRLWALLAPPALVARSCLVVMGSEGRGEQILKTDQDNALVLADGVADDALPALAAAFGAALATFGYPPCPGHIMLANPLWRQPLAGFRASIRDWLLGHDPEGPMRLAIFCDAAPVAGDPALLENLRDFLDALVSDSDIYLARFAAAADQFQEPHHWWARLTGHLDELPLDLKKLGIFPIVHGARALALQHRLHERSTAARLQALVARGALDARLADDLLHALHRLMGTRLAHQLRGRAAGRVVGNEVRPSDLAEPEREGLRDALAVVRRFRAWLRQHFRLDTL